MKNYDLYDLNPPKPYTLKEILDGLVASPKHIHPKYFYDAKGSKLFDAITELPEYYLTRTELSILTDHKKAIADTIGRDALLIEFGSGSSTKIRALLEAVRPIAYMPIDISKAHLEQSAKVISESFPWLNIKAVCADYTLPLELPWLPEDDKRVVFFSGSTLGNQNPDEAADFLGRIRQLVGQKGGLLVGIDKHKPASVLHAAYNDAQGVTATFNLNVLSHINRLTDADLKPELFEHEAVYNKEAGRIEMYLSSLEDHSACLQDHQIHFHKGEKINTELSYKYETETFLRMAQAAGFENAQHWTDPKGYFSVFYLTA